MTDTEILNAIIHFKLHVTSTQSWDSSGNIWNVQYSAPHISLSLSGEDLRPVVERMQKMILADN
jgi:hypothetical protein